MFNDKVYSTNQQLLPCSMDTPGRIKIRYITNSRELSPGGRSFGVKIKFNKRFYYIS